MTTGRRGRGIVLHELPSGDDRQMDRPKVAWSDLIAFDFERHL